MCHATGYCQPVAGRLGPVRPVSLSISLSHFLLPRQRGILPSGRSICCGEASGEVFGEVFGKNGSHTAPMRHLAPIEPFLARNHFPSNCTILWRFLFLKQFLP